MAVGEGAKKTKSVPALERGLAVIEVLSQCPSGMSLSQVRRRLALPRSTTHCLLVTLERGSFVHRDGNTGRYLLAPKLFALAGQALSGIGVRESSLPALRQLSRQTRLTAHMAILADREVFLVAKVEPPGPMRTASWVGQRVGIHCSSLGKALIAYVPEPQLQRILQDRPLMRNNENTITSAKRLYEELACVRALGYALDDEEEELGTRCIGAPVFGPQEQLVASISVSGSTAQIHSGNIEQLAVTVQETATTISQQLKLKSVQLIGRLAASRLEPPTFPD